MYFIYLQQQNIEYMFFKKMLVANIFTSFRELVFFIISKTFFSVGLFCFNMTLQRPTQKSGKLVTEIEIFKVKIGSLP